MNDESTTPLFSVRPSGIAVPEAGFIPEIHRLWTWLRTGSEGFWRQTFAIIPHYVTRRSGFGMASPEFANLTETWPADTEIECWRIDSEFENEDRNDWEPGKGLSIYVLGSTSFPKGDEGCVAVTRPLDAYYLSHLLTLNKPCHREFRAIYPVAALKAVIPPGVRHHDDTSSA